jgi:hypothetical protein
VPRAVFTSSALICSDGESLRASLSVKFDFGGCVYWMGRKQCMVQGRYGVLELWMTETVTSSGTIGIYGIW